jgi:hypothetical protein
MHRSAVLLVALSLTCSLPSAATVLNAGSTTIFDWDLSAANPPPPYSLIVVDFVFDLGTINDAQIDAGVITLFTGPHGTGAEVQSTPFDEFTLPNAFGGLGQIEQTGIFSLVFTVQHGSVAVNPTALGVVAGVRTDPVAGEVFTRSVPEPVTLALLSAGLMGAAFVRRRRASRHRGYYARNNRAPRRSRPV